MANHYPLFHGGNYKRGIDDGRTRKFLTQPELDMVLLDCALPESWMLHMSRHDELNRMQVGDFYYIGVLPDGIMVEMLWLVPQDGYNGLEVELQLVDANEVHDLHCAKADVSQATKFGDKLEADLSVGLCEASCDAIDLACMHDDDYSDHRHPEAYQYVQFDPSIVVPLGKAVYIRMEIKAFTPADNNQCVTCSGKIGLPKLQYGAVVHDMEINKQIVSTYCTCKTKICAGCEDECDEC